MPPEIPLALEAALAGIIPRRRRQPAAVAEGRCASCGPTPDALQDGPRVRHSSKQELHMSFSAPSSADFWRRVEAKGRRGRARFSGAAPASPVAPAGSVDVEKILDDMNRKNPETLDWRVSIVNLMKVLGLDSGLTARKGPGALNCTMTATPTFGQDEHLAAQEDDGNDRRQWRQAAGQPEEGLSFHRDRQGPAALCVAGLFVDSIWN